MSRYEKIWQRIISGRRDRNIDFDDLVWLLEHRGFAKRHRAAAILFLQSPEFANELLYNQRVPRLKDIKCGRFERY